MRLPGFPSACCRARRLARSTGTASRAEELGLGAQPRDIARQFERLVERDRAIEHEIARGDNPHRAAAQQFGEFLVLPGGKQRGVCSEVGATVNYIGRGPVMVVAHRRF
jgi:hypothetical protein